MYWLCCTIDISIILAKLSWGLPILLPLRSYGETRGLVDVDPMLLVGVDPLLVGVDPLLVGVTG